jgi:hypothetical protein
MGAQATAGVDLSGSDSQPTARGEFLPGQDLLGARKKRRGRDAAMVELGGSIGFPGRSADGAEQKHVTLPADFRLPPENGHSRYRHPTAGSAPKQPLTVRDLLPGSAPKQVNTEARFGHRHAAD